MVSFWLAILTLLPAAGAGEPGLRGTVRGTDDGQPIASVSVEVLDPPQRAWSDSSGNYELRGLSAGRHRVRFSRLGYQPFDVEVVVSEAGGLRLDVALRPDPIALERVSVFGDRPEEQRSTRAREAGLGLEVGAHPLSQYGTGGSAGAAPDPLGGLTLFPDVLARPELPTALHVRGGSGDQNAVLLDGVPVYSPYHSAAFLGAINPDVVAGVVAHAGVPPARLGGALSSVVEIGTRPVAGSGFESRGGLGARELRQSVQAPLPAEGGGFLVAGRRSYRDAFSGEDGDPRSGFGDLYAKVTLRAPGGSIDVFGFSSDNRLGFGAVAEAQAADLLPAPSTGAGAEAGAHADAVENRFRWSSRTQGLVWRKAPAGPLRLEARAWRSTMGATAAWGPAAEAFLLESRLADLGVAGRLQGPLAGGLADATLGVTRLATRYGLQRAEATSGAGGAEGFELAASPTIFTGSLEETWRSAAGYVLRTGLRTQVVPGLGTYPEPRLSLGLETRGGLALSAGFARAHQFVQSLRNEESILDAVLGFDLPAAADGRVPVARSDQLAASAAAPLPGGIMLAGDVYVRWLKGLVLVGPATSEPFATDGFREGSGGAWGLGLSLRRDGPRFSADAAYGYGVGRRHFGDQSYAPAFDRRHSFALALSYRVRGRTSVGAALSAFSGTPTTLLADSFGWEPPNSLGTNGEIEGTPRHTAGPLGFERLPPYMRVDLGLRHEWRPQLWGRNGSVTASFDVRNVLDRPNVLGLVADPAAGPSPLRMYPRWFSLGLEWRY